MYFNQLLENEKSINMDEYIQSSTFNIAMESLNFNYEINKIQKNSLNAEIVTEGIIQTIWEKIKAFFTAIWNAIVSLFKTIFRWLGFEKKEMKKQEAIMKKPVSQISSSQVSKTYQSQNIVTPSVTKSEGQTDIHNQSIDKTFNEIDQAQKHVDKNIQTIKHANSSLMNNHADRMAEVNRIANSIQQKQAALQNEREKVDNMNQAIQVQNEKKKEKLTIEDIPISDRKVHIISVNAGSNLKEWEDTIKMNAKILTEFMISVKVNTDTGVVSGNDILDDYIDILNKGFSNTDFDMFNTKQQNSRYENDYTRLFSQIVGDADMENKWLVYSYKNDQSSVNTKRIDGILKILGSKKMFFETSDAPLDEYWGKNFTVKDERKARKEFLNYVEKYIDKKLLDTLKKYYEGMEKALELQVKNSNFNPETNIGNSNIYKLGRLISTGFRVLHFNQLLIFKAIGQICYWSKFQEQQSIKYYLKDNA